MPKPRTFTIHRRPDGKFESRNENPRDSPLGVDRDINMAIGSTVREATLTARTEGCRVVIKVQQPNGKFKREKVIEPRGR